MTTPPTPQAISALLRNAGFAGYGGEHWGFSVFKAALGPDIIVEIRGVSLLEYNPGEGPRALLDDYEAAITAAGYQVRSTGSELIVPPTPAFTEGPVTETKEG